MKEKLIGKYYVRMNANRTSVCAGLVGGLVYYTFNPRTVEEAERTFASLCEDVANW